MKHWMASLLLAGFLAGCGGDDGGGNTTAAGNETGTTQTSPLLAAVNAAPYNIDLNGAQLQAEFYDASASPVLAGVQYQPAAAAIAVPRAQQAGSFIRFSTPTPGASLLNMKVLQLAMLQGSSVTPLPLGTSEFSVTSLGAVVTAAALPDGARPQKVALQLQTSLGGTVWLAVRLQPASSSHWIYSQNAIVGQQQAAFSLPAVRAQNDYSAGSAALASILLSRGAAVNEDHVMNNLLRFGEADKIVERRGFSLLDMKKYLQAIGLQAAGFDSVTLDDLPELFADKSRQTIATATLFGFKQFVVLTGIDSQYVYVASPYFGNLAIAHAEWQSSWEQIVFVVTFPESWRYVAPA